MLSGEITQFTMKRATTTNPKFPDYEVQLKLTSQTFANFTVRIFFGGETLAIRSSQTRPATHYIGATPFCGGVPILSDHGY